MTQQSMFADRPELRDAIPAGATETSREAFDSIKKSLRGADQRRIYLFLAEHGAATCDEAEVALELRHQTCSARFNDLKRAGLIAPTGARRPTRSGRNADVYGTPYVALTAEELPW